MNNAMSEHGLLLNLTGEGTPRLTIQHLNGDIAIAGWDRPAIAVDADDVDEDESLADILNVVQQGNDVRLNLDFSGQLGRQEGKSRDEDFGRGWENLRRLARHFGRSMQLDLQISVPHTCDITVRTANGDITMKRVQGKLFVENASGDVQLTDVRGNVLVKSASADIQVERLEGRLGVRTASGDLGVRASDLSALSVGTASGDIQIDAALRPGEDYEVQTISGDVQLCIPGDTPAEVTFETVSGELECSLPHEKQKLGKRQRLVRLNGGGDTRLRIRTTSGDAEVCAGTQKWSASWAAAAAEAGGPEPTRRFDPSEVGEAEHFRAEAAEVGSTDEGAHTQRLGAHADAPAGPRKSAEMTILEAIESGEMTVDEGLRRLGELAQ